MWKSPVIGSPPGDWRAGTPRQRPRPGSGRTPTTAAMPCLFSTTDAAPEPTSASQPGLDPGRAILLSSTRPCARSYRPSSPLRRTRRSCRHMAAGTREPRQGPSAPGRAMRAKAKATRWVLCVTRTLEFRHPELDVTIGHESDVFAPGPGVLHWSSWRDDTDRIMTPKR